MIGKITNPKQRMIGCILIVLLSSLSLLVSKAQSSISLENIQEIRALDLHPNGQILAIGGRVNDQRGFWLYNLITGNIDVIETAGNVASISWSPSGLRIAGDIGIGDATTFQIFDVASKQLLLSFEQTVSPPIIVWDLNSSRVATTDGTTIYIRNVSSGNVDMTLSILPVETLYSLSSIAWDNSTNQRMYGLVGSEAKKILVWSTATGTLLQQYTIPFHSESLSLSPDFTKLAVGSLDGDGNILILDASNGTVLATLQGPPNEYPQALVWQADSRHLAGYGGPYDGGLIRTWDTVTAQQIQTIPVPSYVHYDELVWSADGSQLISSPIDNPVTIVQPPVANAGLDQTVTDSDNNGSELVILDGSSSTDSDGTIVSYSWSTNGAALATGVSPQVSLLAGVHTVTLTVTDDDGVTDRDDVIITVIGPIATPTATATMTNTPAATHTPTFTPIPSGSCSVTISASDAPGLINTISAANANGSSADTICLTANSTYTLTVVNNSTDGPNGLPSITSDITIVGNGATITRDPAAPAFRIFHVAAGGSLTLDGVTISGGSATSAAPGNDGGAIYNRGTVNLTGNTSITNSTASADGGAVYNRGTFNIAAGSSISDNTAADDGGGVYTSSGTLNVAGGTITDNTAGDEGGGIRSVDSTITLTGANITDNTATSGSGGGLYTTSTTLTVTNGVFSGNGGNSGGGLYFTNSPSAASLDGVQITNNTGTNGGGLYLTSSGQAALTSVTVSGNQATSSAAGIWSGGTLMLTDSTVSNNGNTSQPGSAGGIRAAGATLTVSDTVISGNLVNSSSGSGAGVYIASTGNALIDGGEISGNDARNGGGLYNSGSLSLSSIIDDNAAQHYGGGLYITGGTAHVDGSIFSNNTAVDRGGAVYNGVTTASWIHDSCITGNTSADTGGVYSNTAAFDAIDNWWGAASGPSGAGAGTGDAANSNVTFSPFLTAGCPSGTGEGSTQQMMGLQVQMRGAETTATLAPVRVPFRATFEDEVDWGFGGAWVLDTLNGRNKAPSWTVNTSSRGEASILEMRAPINLRGTQSPQLTFWERGQIAPSDVITVEVLPEGASTWSVVDIRSTVPSTWTPRSVSLSAYRGQTIRLRVRVVAGGELEDGTRSTGVWIDDWGVEGR